MGEIKRRLIECAEREWRYFGGSTRDIDDVWRLAGDEADEPFTSRVGEYWSAVGHPTWDGTTDEPWSAAFISWCFGDAGAGDLFWPHDTHSVYVDRIRRHDHMTDALTLVAPRDAPLEPGDLIWNSRQLDALHPDPDIPLTYEDAVDQLIAGNFFPSHVDIVISVAEGACDSIGGNVSNLPVGGSVTRTTWRLSDQGLLADDRKPWVGVIKNGL